jgi:uncharacterized protein (UPF0548 family)
VIYLRQPTTDALTSTLASWLHEPLSYQGQSLQAARIEGFITDQHRIRLGHGREVYQRACTALDQWQMFPLWSSVARLHDGGQQEGQIVAMVVQICGLWWVNPCRILRRCDSGNTHGFVYGTLPEHAECGEEKFIIRQESDGSVWYEIRAFSRPRHWLAWLAFPLARWWQCRFVRDSQAAMVKWVNNL